MLSSNSNPNDPQAFYYAQPPIPLEYTVQKLAQPLEGGENLIFRVQYVEDSAMQNRLNIYNDGSVVMTLKDDGVYPDAVAKDYKYAALMKQDVTKFVTDIKNREAIIALQGYVRHFAGHASKILNANEVVLFDQVRFNNNLETGINPYIFDVNLCQTDLKKENSLFITDLSVVENPSNTFNVVTGQGNPIGAWTFGSMMMRMCNPASTGLDPRDFLKEWVKLGRMTEQYQKHFIVPWIEIARRKSGDPLYSFPHTNLIDVANNWETEWNNTDLNALYRYAPFKLTAIVNRLDLKGNGAYGGPFFNAGETRFIFTYIIPDDNHKFPLNGKKGDPPIAEAMEFGGGLTQPGGEKSWTREDWRGMNIIFEYHNVQKSKCELKTFAQLWANLSTMTLGSSQYIAALTAITNTVTNYNSLPGAPNNNALARIRSNEKCFANSRFGVDSSWDNANWEFRQFEINTSTHYFELRPLTNTPKDEYLFGNTQIKFAPSMPWNNQYYELFDWAFSSPIIRERIRKGNHIIPSTYNNETLLAEGSVQVSGEAVHYFDFPQAYLTGQNGIFTSPTAADYLMVKEMRYQLSLNTCQGCHAGENKTLFTHVRPIGYGQNGDYWSATPDFVKGTQNLAPGTSDFGKYFTDIDKRPTSPLDFVGMFYSWTSTKGNPNFTKELFNNTTKPNYDVNFPTDYPMQVVSPFLTGRVYNGKINGVDNWDDDNIEPGVADNSPNSQFNKLGDEGIQGDDIVNDPSNKANAWPIPFPGLDHTKWGHNDLEIRKVKLCEILQKTCPSPIDLMDIIQEINHIPLPLGAH